MDDQTFLKYKKIFFGWAAKNWSGLDDNAIEEVFFNALSVFLEYQKKGKIKVQASTFIISVAHRMLQVKHKKQTLELVKDVPDEVEEKPQRQVLMRKALKRLDEKCRQLLISKYFYNLSMEEIMLETAAKSREVVRTQKKRCMKKLKTITLEMMTTA
jgi:RNA polymerase sigma factor (sigma-70 family)